MHRNKNKEKKYRAIEPKGEVIKYQRQSETYQHIPFSPPISTHTSKLKWLNRKNVKTKQIITMREWTKIIKSRLPPREIYLYNSKIRMAFAMVKFIEFWDFLPVFLSRKYLFKQHFYFFVFFFNGIRWKVFAVIVWMNWKRLLLFIVPLGEDKRE